MTDALLLPHVKDKSFWEEIKNNPAYKPFIDKQAELYEIYCKDDIKALKYSEYKIFFGSGSREEYERSYFYRRVRLNTLTMLCLLYPENTQYLEELQDTVWAICDEYCWALPAHVRHAKGPDVNDNTLIDLFAAETGFALSEIYSFMNDRFAPLINSRIVTEVERRIINSFMERSFSFENMNSNWAAVCGGSVAAAFMYIAPDKFDLVKPRIDSAMEHFLQSYMDDGVCREGVGYWAYGFGFFTFYADLLKRFTNGKEDLFADEKIKTIATFQQKAFLRKNITASFADGSVKSSFGIGLTYMLKNIYGDDIVIPNDSVTLDDGTIRGNGAAKSPKYGSIGDACGRWAPVIRAFLFYNPDYDIAAVTADSDFYLRDSAWYIKKSEKYSFACKAGDNNEPHNHNDIGCFIIATDNGQTICDTGAGEYTRQYFQNETRYDILCNSSFGHSLPIINGKPQHGGADYHGSMDVLDGSVKISFADAYDEPSLVRLERVFTFDTDTVHMTDSFAFENDKGDMTERFITLYKPEVSDGSIKIGDTLMSFDVKMWSLSVSEESFSNHQGVRETLYKIDLDPINGAKQFDASFKMI